MTEKTNIVVRVDRALWRRFKMMAVDRDVTVVALLEETIAALLKGKDEPSAKKVLLDTGEKKEKKDRPTRRSLDAEDEGDSTEGSSSRFRG